MSNALSLRLLRQKLHLSYSQVNSYLTCSLRYYFHYVKGLPPEHLNSALLLGTAVHEALAAYFQSLQENGHPGSPTVVLDLYRDSLRHNIAAATVPILFKAEAPDADALVEQGEGLLKAFLADPGYQNLEVVAVELPLAAPLSDADGHPGDVELIGAIDLLLRDQLGHLVAIDHKTAKAAFTQDTVDADMQLSAYAHLLRATGYLNHQEPLSCGFNVLRKLKTPIVQRPMTLRSRADSERFARLAQAVLGGIEAQTYLPCPGWQCADCSHQRACRQW